MDKRSDAILIAGPTASGKSNLALELAERHNGIIINSDSMQVYPILRILTARPDSDDLSRIPHYLYGHVSLEHSYSVARWIDDVGEILATVKLQGKVPVFVGGTGLYFKALLEGLATIPEVAPEIREYWREQSRQTDTSSLHSELLQRDPKAAATLKPNDTQRIVRALEVFDATGVSIIDHQQYRQGSPLLGGNNIKKYLLLPDRPDLHQRIENRFDRMVEQGAIEEVKALLMAQVPEQHPVLKAIGVPQFKQYLKQEISLDEACNRCKIATRQYAKRQSTWFRNQLSDDWVKYR